MSKTVLPLMMILVLCLGANAPAGTIEIIANASMCIRSGEPDTVNAWPEANVRQYHYPTTQDELHAALKFDLSGVTQEITGAYLRLYQLVHSKNNQGVVQEGYLVNPHDISSITWNKVYGGSPEFTVTALDSLGSYNMPDDTPSGAWYDTDAASASDVSALETLRTGTSKNAVILLVATEMQQWWGGIYTPGGDVPEGCEARLVLEVVPEPATLSLLAAGGLLALLRKRK
jgi:hypothetical protein